MSLQKKYKAKLLLFGEYTVVLGGEVLAIPFPRYGGRFDFLQEKASASQQKFHTQLQAFADFLVKTFPSKYNTKAFLTDLRLGLFFDSNIPQGYGVGSSGALCAAVYDRYFINKPKEVEELKQDFATMESYFHGSSSGIDPLIAYLDKGLHLASKSNFEIVDLSLDFLEKAGIYLVDTGLQRKTQPLVDLFLENCKIAEYKKQCAKLARYNQAAIQATLAGDIPSIKENFQAISAFQWLYFQGMIPERFRELWEKGLSSGEYAIKLCGAGGGGFLLGIRL